MRIKPPTPAQSIPELLAQLPTDRLDATDIACLKALKSCMHTLRVDDASTGWLFPHDVRLYFAIEMNNALAGIIKTRIPTRGVGRPRMTDDKKAQVLASNTFKVCIINLIAALNAFLRRSATLWDAIPAEYIPTKLSDAIGAVRAAFVALEEAVPDDAALIKAVNDMSAHVTKFERMVTYWQTITTPCASKNEGMHAFPLVPEWIDACRALALANSLYLQRIK